MERVIAIPLDVIPSMISFVDECMHILGKEFYILYRKNRFEKMIKLQGH